MAGYTEDDMKANVRTHVPDFDMASEIMSRVSLSRVLLDALKETRMADDTPDISLLAQLDLKLKEIRDATLELQKAKREADLPERYKKLWAEYSRLRFFHTELQNQILNREIFTRLEIPFWARLRILLTGTF